MSVDIERVIPGVVIVACCNMNPLSYWKNLSSCYGSQCLKISFHDSTEKSTVLNLHTDSVMCHTDSVIQIMSCDFILCN